MTLLDGGINTASTALCSGLATIQVHLHADVEPNPRQTVAYAQVRLSDMDPERSFTLDLFAQQAA